MRRYLLVAVIPLVLLIGYQTLRVRPATWDEVQAAVRSKDWKGAESRLVRLLAINQDDGRAWLQLGAVRSLQGRDDEAIEAFDRVKERDPAYAEAQTLLGDLRLKGNDARTAEQAFRRGIAADARAVRPRQRLVYLLLLEGRGDEVRPQLWELYEIDRDPRSLVTLVGQSIAEGDARDVAPELDRLLQLAPDDPWLRRARGLTRVALGRAAEGLPDLEFAATWVQDDPTLRLALGEAQLLLRNLAAIDRALGERPADPRILSRWWLLKARAGEAKGDRDAAFDALRKAVEADPRNRVARYKLGQESTRRGKDGKPDLELAESIRANESALKSALDRQLTGTGRRDAEAYENLARLCLEAGLNREAHAWYEQALRADPTRIETRSALAAVPPSPRETGPLPSLRDRPLDSPGVTRTAATETPRLRFRDEAEERGLVFTYDPHARGDLFIGDTMGGGVALFDYDNDGDLDVYLVGGCTLPVDPKAPPAPNKLFRNKGDGHFEDATATAGVGGRGYGMGACVGDYDGDGHEDLFVTGLGSTVLYRNKGDGTFEDVTSKAGASSDRWTTAAGFADLDADGDLDLVAVTYVAADPKSVPDCRDQLNKPIHCPPTRFAAQVDHLFRNNGDGTFTDVADSAGLNIPRGDGLGLAIADLDADGKLDLFVANDTEPDFLFRNLGALRFEEVGVAAGVALDGTGRATASMGVVAADLDGDGLIDLFHTNFNNEPNTFLKGLGNGQFRDATAETGLDAPSRPMTGFGTNVLDADNDGLLDLFVANGHVDEQPWFQIPMAQVPQLFAGGRGGRFRLVPPEDGSYFSKLLVGRGSAAGDLDGDGRVDLVVVHRDAPVSLLRNINEGGRGLGLRLLGEKSGRWPVGARVTCKVGGRTLVRWLTSGTSYLASSDPTVWLGAGSAKAVDSIEVRWPSGKTQAWSGLETGLCYDLKEGGEPVAQLNRTGKAASPISGR